MASGTNRVPLDHLMLQPGQGGCGLCIRGSTHGHDYCRQVLHNSDGTWLFGRNDWRGRARKAWLAVYRDGEVYATLYWRHATTLVSNSVNDLLDRVPRVAGLFTPGS